MWGRERVDKEVKVGGSSRHTGVHEAVSETGEVFGGESEEVEQKLFSLLLRPPGRRSPCIVVWSARRETGEWPGGARDCASLEPVSQRLWRDRHLS